MALNDDLIEDTGATTQPTVDNSDLVEDTGEKPSSFMGVTYDPSKNDFKNKGIVKTLWDEFTKSPDPSAKALMQSVSYPGGIVSDAGIEALKRFTGHDGLGSEEWKKALGGNATPATEQLKNAGYGRLAQYAAGIPYQIATDPLASIGGSALKGAAEPLAEAAESAAVRHLRPTPKVAQVLGPDKLSDIGREALDSGAIKFGKKAEDTAANLSNLKNESGALIGDMIDASNQTTHPHAVAAKFDQDVIEPLRGTAENQDLVKTLEGKKQAFLDKYGLEPMSAAQVEAEKRAVQGNINYLTDPKSKQKAQMGWANTLKKEGEGIVNDPAFQDAKRAYGNQAAGEKMASRSAALTDGGTGLMGHLADLGVGLEGLKLLAHGNPAGAGAIAARGLTKGRVASSLATTLDSLSKFAGSKYAPLIDTLARRKMIDVTNNGDSK